MSIQAVASGAYLIGSAVDGSGETLGIVNVDAHIYMCDCNVEWRCVHVCDECGRAAGKT